MIEVSVVEGVVSVLSLCTSQGERCGYKVPILPDIGHSGCSYFMSYLRAVVLN